MQECITLFNFLVYARIKLARLFEKISKSKRRFFAEIINRTDKGIRHYLHGRLASKKYVKKS